MSGGSGCTQICQQKWTVWGGEGEGAQNASTRICNLPISNKPIIFIYNLKEICLKQSPGYNPDVLSQTYRTRLNRPSECGPHSENFPGSRLHVPYTWPHTQVSSYPSHTNSPWSSGVLDLEVSLLIFIIPQSFLRMLEVRSVYNTGFQWFKLYSLFSIWQLSRPSQGSHIIYILKRMKRLGYPFHTIHS